MRFALSNPRWRPPPPARRFLGHLQAQVTRDAATAPPPRHLLAEGPLAASLLSEDSALAVSGAGSGGATGCFECPPDECPHSPRG